MNDMILTTDIRAKIAADGHVADGKLEVDSDDGVVTIGGKVDSLVEADIIKKIITDFPGVRDVVPKLRIIGAR